MRIFFDKLVNDDDDVDFKVTSASASGGHTILTDGNESDEVKAFANLSINELDDNGGVNFDNIAGSDHHGVEDLNAKVETVECINEVGTVEEHGDPSMSSNSFEADLVQNLGNDNGGAEEVPYDAACPSSLLHFHSTDCGLFVTENMRSGRNTSNILRSINPITEDEIERLSQQLRLRVLLWLLNHDNNMLRKTVTTEALCWFDRVHIKRKEMEGSDSARIAKHKKQTIVDKPWKSVPVSFKHAL